MPALLLLTGPSSGLRYEVQTEASLGRSSTCEIPLEDGKVSRRHARVEVRAGQAFLADLGSRNGTLLNGERVAKEMLLRPGDRFQVGETTVLFEPTAPDSVDAATQADFDAALADQLLPTDGLASFMVALGKASLAAPSGPAVLRQGAEQIFQKLSAEWVTILLQQSGGIVAACSLGAAQMVPRPISQRVLSKGEAVWDGKGLCVPFGPAASAYGVLFVERDAAFTPDERQLVVTAGRLLGDIWHQGHQQVLGLARAPVGSSEAFTQVLDRIRKAAAGNDHVFLCGASGTGKRMLADYVHARSKRATGPCVEVDGRDAAAVIEDSLFGRTASAGVPALNSALSRADGGTLVLHHVEALPRVVTERLGRYLGRKSAPGLKGDDHKVDVRVVATSSQRLSALSAEGHSTLVNALSALEIQVPSLKDHASDIPELFAHFTGAVCARSKQAPPTLTSEAQELLTAYGWPHNVEELRLLAERLALLYPGEEIPTFHLPSELQKVTGGGQAPSLQDMISRLEKDAISEALRLAKGKKIKAAALLDISRPTLDKKIEDYNLKVEKVRDE